MTNGAPPVQLFSCGTERQRQDTGHLRTAANAGRQWERGVSAVPGLSPAVSCHQDGGCERQSCQGLRVKPGATARLLDHKYSNLL